MKKFLVAIAMVAALSGCYSSKDANRALDSAGYSNVEIHGRDWFACGEGDFYATKFTAVNPVGKPTQGAVCSGFIFKNATIRH